MCFVETPAVSCSPERQLITDLQAGSDGAFDRLYEKYSGLLFSVLRSKGTSVPDSEDIVQETFCRVARSIEKLDPEKSLAGYLRTIAVRIAIDKNRSRLRDPSRCAVQIDSVDPGGDDIAVRESDTIGECSMVMAVLDQQPEQTKEILRLYFFEQMTYRQIAEKLQIGVTTTKDRVRKAVGVVRDQIPTSG